ncbi:hypothetical protein BT96DRAFT_527410 [Gymnopus androsaceus JB14]|uniref:Uncharacterized protein n=1 Tax=Gymnopus androsaceus JB14 TaxID=1447944 RepID=A0A6A4IM41_9AGAR|nr:hypothetical protein BT96DRAFT_527410 [Gymnopus androsaceus JB14]
MELSPNWSYDVRSWNAHVIKVWDCEYSSVISEEGWTRFSFSSYIPFGPFEITYTLAVAENFAATLRAAWLAQARYTANERCINPCNFVLLDHICFTLTFIFDYDITLRERPLYLFVAPMILGADDGQYGLSSLNQLSITPMPLMSYWSFDPRGQVSRIRDDKATLTKLPNHTLSISGGSQWKTYQYEAIQQYQRLIPCDFNSRSYAEIHGLPKVHILWPPHEQDIDEITFTESPQPEISLLDFTELRKELQDIGESPETGDDRKETDESQETTESWSSYSPPTSSPDTLDVADASPAVPRKIPIIHLEEIDGKNADDHQQLLGELVQDATSSLMQEIDILQTTSELENPFDEVPSPLSTGLRDFDDVEQSWSIL